LSLVSPDADDIPRRARLAPFSDNRGRRESEE